LQVNVRFGSKADIGARPYDVRFTPKSGHWNSPAKALAFTLIALLPELPLHFF
jgi:hypothetical protein